jgi:hypothetical protein
MNNKKNVLLTLPGAICPIQVPILSFLANLFALKINLKEYLSLYYTPVG